MIVDVKNPLWPYMDIQDGNGNSITTAFEYHIETKEVSKYIEDETFIFNPERPMIIGKLVMDELGKAKVERKIFPNSFIIIK